MKKILASAAVAVAIAGAAATPASAALGNPYQGCWVEYWVSTSQDRGFARDAYDTCSGINIGVQHRYQPNAPTPAVWSPVDWDPDFAKTSPIPQANAASYRWKWL